MFTPVLESYQAKKWPSLSNLHGISDKTLEVHFGLYAGYVKNTNLLNEHLADLVKEGKATASDPRYAELKRRLGFEYDGMVLHEYYFDNMTANGSGEAPAGALRDALARSYGDFETWKKDFTATGALRGVGWAIAYQDPKTGRIVNEWVTLHEDGNLAGYRPIVVMDVWEHAWLLDYAPADRPKYIEAFFANIDWTACAKRLIAGPEG